MKGLQDNCPGCGNAYFFREGASQGYGCDIEGCLWGAVTSYHPAIFNDPTVYAVSIEALPDDSLRSIARLALRLNIPATEARRWLRDLPIQVADLRAPEVFALRCELESEGYRVSISPSFPHEVFDPEPQGQFALSAEEILLFQLNSDES